MVICVGESCQTQVKLALHPDTISGNCELPACCAGFCDSALWCDRQYQCAAGNSGADPVGATKGPALGLRVNGHKNAQISLVAQGKKLGLGGILPPPPNLG